MTLTKEQEMIQNAYSIFNGLTASRLTERYKAVERMNDPDCLVDLPTLKDQLIKAITGDYAVGRENEQDDPDIAKTRSWLLGMLARLATGDAKATQLVIKHMDANFEPNDWTRYWAFEGFILGKNSECETLAKQLYKESASLVGMLANAFLASRNDKTALETIKTNLAESDKIWYVLRALRIVPLPATVPTLCKIVKEASYTDEAYDALMAIGVIPSNWTHTAEAAEALSTFIRKVRGTPWKDSMRSSALTGLGKLKVESTASLIIEELTDDNPSIVREAARAIEKILGLRLTVLRVVESALKNGAADVETYARALRWLNRSAVAEELETLMTLGSTEQQEMARKILGELGGTAAYDKLRARTDTMKQYTDILAETEKKVRDLFDATVREAQGGFQIAVVMDTVVFAVGILLLISSAGYALFATGDLSKWAGVGVSGGLGVLGIVYGVLISNPRRQVRESVDHLMTIKIVFLSYLRRLHQADQAYTRRLLDDEPITVADVREFADLIGKIMDDTVEQQKGASPKPDGPAKITGNNT